MNQPATNNFQPLLGDIRTLIEQSRQQLTVTVNSALTLLYWHIGQRIRHEVLNGERASYGEQMIATLAKQLEADYGRGFSAKNLRHMLRFAEAFADIEIVSAARRQLSWTHFKTLIYVDEPLENKQMNHQRRVRHAHQKHHAQPQKNGAHGTPYLSVSNLVAWVSRKRNPTVCAQEVVYG